MENIELNRKAVRILEEWDPFQLGTESYETETADVVAALQGITQTLELAEVIQSVYEYSFEQWIPLDDCLTIADKLIALRHQASCEL